MFMLMLFGCPAIDITYDVDLGFTQKSPPLTVSVETAERGEHSGLMGIMISARTTSPIVFTTPPTDRFYAIIVSDLGKMTVRDSAGFTPSMSTQMGESNVIKNGEGGVVVLFVDPKRNVRSREFEILVTNPTNQEQEVVFVYGITDEGMSSFLDNGCIAGCAWPKPRDRRNVTWSFKCSSVNGVDQGCVETSYR